MKEIHVEVKADHLRKLAMVRKSILAIVELVWNSLDADATKVYVEFAHNRLGGLQTITVADNGHGIDYEEAFPAFQNLGGSWKTNQGRSKTKRRLLHGKAGKGRFRAFSLGNRVTWITRYSSDSEVKEFSIVGSFSDLGTFSVGDPETSSHANPGTSVVVSDIQKNFRTIHGPAALQEITSYFALYLRQYPDVSIWYDGSRADPTSVQEREEDYSLEPLTLQDGRVLEPGLTVIEWKTPADRSLFLCDANGFALAEVPPGIHAPGFVFTAYLKCDFLRELDDQGALVLEELHPDLKAILDASKRKLREHFRKRTAESAANLVQDWKGQDIYPYRGEPANLIERAERQVFDVLALNINSYLPDFESADPQSKRLSFRLLRQALAEGPRAVQRIIREVLDLPQDKQRELADLLERTSLAAIINASKIVADRLDFVRILEILLFEHKNRLLERSQLHKLLEDQTWIFGEEFSLTLSDKGLTEVLRRHLKILGRKELCPEPVKREDGSIGIVDLMLSRRIPQARGDQREHLIVELKRPEQKIDSAAAQQIESYALAVAQDERFRDSVTRWVFWAVSNELTDDVRRKTRQRNRPDGLLYDDQERPLSVWVKSWGEILDDSRGRLQFFQEHLEYSTDDESALAKLREVHEKYLPPEAAAK